jgi:hypothetical protein
MIGPRHENRKRFAPASLKIPPPLNHRCNKVTITIESASAHDKGCDGNPVPAGIKLDCCGGTEEHQLKPEQIRRGANNEYIVSIEGYTFVIPADRALPSNDPCSHIFFPNMWVNDDGGGQVRNPKTPSIRCFLTPLDF